MQFIGHDVFWKLAIGVEKALFEIEVARGLAIIEMGDDLVDRFHLLALGPALVSADALPSALALRSIAFQSGTVAGPALGGLAYTVAPHLPYGIMVVFCVLAALLMNLIPAAPSQPVKDNATPDDIFAIGSVTVAGAS